jgi:UDP-N-acetyl-D-glucosamine dehydrogenase
MSTTSEKSKIIKFLQKNAAKKIVIVQGLGFVGAVMAIVIANSENEEYAVIGVDLPNSFKKIDAMNNGIFPIKSSDPKISEYFNNAIRKENFLATSNCYVYSKADVIIIDINLDVYKKSDFDKHLLGYEINLSAFSDAVRTIAHNCKENVLVLVETTVPPGTCEKIVKPIFEEEFKKRELDHNYKIGHSYERVMPGPNYIDSIKNFYRVYSGIDEESANSVEKFLKTIIKTDQYPLTRVSNTTASEMGKVLENSFRAMNIAFIQEWTEFAEKAGVNLFEIIKAIRMRPTHVNIMQPGLGAGGYCLTKDSLLASWASKELFGSESLSQIEKAIEINDQMPLHTYKVIKKYFNNNISGKKFLILGISYLKNIADTRYTPVELLYDKLQADRAIIELHDPFVSYWPEKNLTTADSDYIFEKSYDAIVIGTPHDFYFNESKLDSFFAASNKFVVFDPHGSISDELFKKYCNKHDFVLNGRGDV